jgi:hypothetical protein
MDGGCNRENSGQQTRLISPPVERALAPFHNGMTEIKEGWAIIEAIPFKDIINSIPFTRVEI